MTLKYYFFARSFAFFQIQAYWWVFANVLEEWYPKEIDKICGFWSENSRQFLTMKTHVFEDVMIVL